MPFIYSLISIDVPFSSLDTDIDTAFNYFKSIYPEIEKTDRDTFIYRGIEFNYFQSGYSPLMNPETNKPYPGTYTLVDKDDCRIWLCSYGDKKECWNDYIKQKTQRDEFLKRQRKRHQELINPTSLFTKFLYWLKK